MDNGPEYAEYRITGISGGGWSRELYLLKVGRIAEAIRRSVPGGPDIVALQEVENRNALLRLRDRGLRGLGYRAAVLVEEPGCAVHPALLSRYPVRRTGLLAVGAGGERGILEAEIEVGGATLHLFNNHWKSRSGGGRETEAQRREAARVLEGRLRALLAGDPAADIVVLGDLNEEVAEGTASGAALARFAPGASAGVLLVADRPEQAGLRGGRPVLVDPSAGLPAAERASYVFRGRWQALDHVFVSAGLFDRKGLGYAAGSFRVVRDPYLLDPDTGFPRSWRERGVSDHLPLLITLEICEQESR